MPSRDDRVLLALLDLGQLHAATSSRSASFSEIAASTAFFRSNRHASSISRCSRRNVPDLLLGAQIARPIGLGNIRAEHLGAAVVQLLLRAVGHLDHHLTTVTVDAVGDDARAIGQVRGDLDLDLALRQRAPRGRLGLLQGVVKAAAVQDLARLLALGRSLADLPAAGLRRVQLDLDAAQLLRSYQCHLILLRVRVTVSVAGPRSRRARSARRRCRSSHQSGRSSQPARGCAARRVS